MIHVMLEVSGKIMQYYVYKPYLHPPQLRPEIPVISTYNPIYRMYNPIEITSYN